jgi:predicted metalloprotease with PDZ domain
MGENPPQLTTSRRVSAKEEAMRPTWYRVLLLALLVLLLAAVMIQAGPAKTAEPIMPLVMERGAMITHVTPGGPADKAGLEVGEVIVAVNGMVVTSEAMLEQALKLSPIARLEMIRLDEGRREQVLVIVGDDGLGVRVKMAGPESGPFFPRYRRWV